MLSDEVRVWCLVLKSIVMVSYFYSVCVLPDAYFKYYYLSIRLFSLVKEKTSFLSARLRYLCFFYVLLFVCTDVFVIL